MSAYFRNTFITLLCLLGWINNSQAQEGNYYLTWRNPLNSIAFIAHKAQQNSEVVATNDYYWNGELEREFGKGLRVGIVLATAKKSHRFRRHYNVDIDNYYQKSFSVGIGGKFYNIASQSNLKLQGGLYAYLNWLAYRDIFQVNHYYGVYEEEISFRKKAIPSFVAHFAILHQLGKSFEIEYAGQISINRKIKNQHREYYYLVSTGFVYRNGISPQLQLSLKYAISRK